MTETKEEINIARIVYDAYPHSDLLPIDPDQDCRTLRSLLETLCDSQDRGSRLFDGQGQIRQEVTILLNGRNVVFLDSQLS